MGTEFLTIEGTVLKGCAKKATGKIVIPEGVTEIGKSAFVGCSSLAKVVIPECFRKSVKRIFGDGFNRKCLNFY